MAPLDSYAFFPAPPRAAHQRRRLVCPVWWMTSDESSHSTSGLDERYDEPTIRDETLQKMIQTLQPVQFEASNPPVHADNTERDPAKVANRLRRQPAVISLSKQYLESGKCSSRKSHEAAPVRRQTIQAAAATQSGLDGTNYRASRHLVLSGGTNQPGKIKISSSSRGANAQTEAATSEAYLCGDEGDTTGEEGGHKTELKIRLGTENTRSRSSIASEETASIRGFGNARASIRLVQHSEAPKLLPQRAEFLNAPSINGRYESLLPRRRDHSSAHNHTEERSKLSRTQFPIARFNTFSAPANEERQKRRQAAMRVEISPRRAWSGHDDDLVKLAASRHWGDQSNPKNWLLDADNMLSHRSQASAHMPQQGRGANGRLPPAPGIPTDRQPRSDIVFGQARAVKMSKPGEARLVKLTTKKSRPFNINCLSSEEANLMASMGAVARSSRRSSTWTDDEQSRNENSPDIPPAAENVLPKPGPQPSRIPRAIPRAKEGADRSSKQPVDQESRDGQEDGRFHQLLQWLETNDRKTSRDLCHPPARGKARTNRRQGATPGELSEMPVIHDQCLMIINPSSGLEHNQGYLSLYQRHKLIDDGPLRFRQLVRRLDTSYPEPTFPWATPVDTTPNTRDSGCPSLVSDDGRESTSSPSDMAYEYARGQIFQGPHRIDGWETDDDAASTVAPHEMPLKNNSDLFDVSTDENELVSEQDASEDHTHEHASDGNGYGRLYREPEAVTSSLTIHQGDLPGRLREQRRGGSRTTATQPNELGLYAKRAILRWMRSTTDAPDTPGMHDESGRWWELLNVKDTYQRRYGDETRVEISTALRFLSGAEEPRPEPSNEAQAVCPETLPPSAP